MRAGLLQYQIEIYHTAVSKDVYGATITNWELYKKTRANIKVDRGDKIIEAQEVISDYSVTFIIRDYINIDDTMRIYWSNKKYDIISIIPDKQAKNLTLSCRLINE